MIAGNVPLLPVRSETSLITNTDGREEQNQ